MMNCCKSASCYRSNVGSGDVFHTNTPLSTSPPMLSSSRHLSGVRALRMSTRPPAPCHQVALHIPVYPACSYSDCAAVLPASTCSHMESNAQHRAVGRVLMCQSSFIDKQHTDAFTRLQERRGNATAPVLWRNRHVAHIRTQPAVGGQWGWQLCLWGCQGQGHSTQQGTCSGFFCNQAVKLTGAAPLGKLPPAYPGVVMREHSHVCWPPHVPLL